MGRHIPTYTLISKEGIELYKAADVEPIIQRLRRGMKVITYGGADVTKEMRKIQITWIRRAAHG